MATHSCILAWEIPWTEEPGGLQYVVSQKSLTQLSCFAKQQSQAMGYHFLAIICKSLKIL